jgi:hypothetical protein
MAQRDRMADGALLPLRSDDIDIAKGAHVLGKRFEAWRIYTIIIRDQYQSFTMCLFCHLLPSANKKSGRLPLTAPSFIAGIKCDRILA